MKQIIVKRLMYDNVITHERFYGAEEYDGETPNWQILSSICTVGKYEWIPHFCALYQFDKNGKVTYQVTVEEFRRFQKSWYNLVWDWVRRIV